MVKKKLLVTGSKGQLGRDLIETLSPQFDITGFDIDRVDIRNLDQIISFFDSTKPDVVLHGAAFTDVDECETNIETAMAVNSDGTANIALACKEINARLIYYSTDYVFDGTKKSPYIETDEPNPQTVYGKSKLAGEQKIAEIIDDYAILRIAWLYGAHGKNFVRTMIKIGNDQLQKAKLGQVVDPLMVVNDQFGAPTWAIEVARQTKIVIDNDLNGIYHCTAEGETDWYDFAKIIFEELSLNVYLKPCTTEQLPRPAPRPKYSVLENKKLKDLNLNIMADYKTALKEFFNTNGATLKS
jgi:dTDP-4-dehydrorhamnose reductase